ncbi:MAG TPA: exopolysaccharide biosynthesis polyprenyl glycosylphosphotransferase [Candidatus Binataceae bacterium]|nr:exopolysaccharide biosynthesis polyprenyl glycosylphosphotransferase [Candidatus Binataceae bacterium]
MLKYQPLALKTIFEASSSASDTYLVRNESWRARWKYLISLLARNSVLLLCDLFALLIASMFGYVIWAEAVLHQPTSQYLSLFPLLFLFPLVYAAAGLYPGFGLGAVEILRRLFYCTSLCFLGLAAASFALKADPTFSRMTYVIAWASALIVVPMCRLLTLSIVKPFRWWSEPTIIFGTPAQARLTIRSLKRAFSIGYTVVGVLCPDGQRVGQTVEDVPILGGLELLPELAQQGVVTLLAWDDSSVMAQLVQTQTRLRHMIFIREDRLYPVERVKIRNLGGVLGIEFTNELLRRPNQIMKRSLDVILSTAGLVITLPIIGLCALLIKVTSPGPVFFRQTREGLGGRKFKVWKLRTMCTDAEDRLVDLLKRDPELKRQWQRSAKLPRDPRLIPVVGSLLRRLSLDELPQLWNVIVGDMSLVGPRPFPDYHLAMLSPDYKRLRSAVRPGLTGMWQITVRSNGRIEEQERFDTYYIRNWSLWLDLYILARTATVVLTARGAY